MVYASYVDHTLWAIHHIVLALTHAVCTRFIEVKHIYIFNYALHSKLKEIERIRGCVVAKTAADFIDEATLLKHQFAS
jgi:hypothetical protein